MNDRYTNDVLARARSLQQAEYAVIALMNEDRTGAFRAALAAALAALMALYPSVSAALTLL